MPNNIELIVALLLPVVVLTVLRINAAMVFLSLCLGYVLVQFVANDANSLINFVAPNNASVSGSTLRLGMLFIPAVLTCLITLFSVKGQIRSLLNVLPAVGAAALAAILTVPLLTPGLRFAIQDHTSWHSATRAQAAVVGAGAFVSLLFLWSQRRHAKHEEHGKHHRH